MKSYFAYIRVSTQKQGRQGVSLAEQRDAIERYAQRNDLAVVEWFEETLTAAKSGRPVFARMLARLEAGEAAGVLIHKIDRSARNLRDWASLGELIDRGVEVHFATESLDLQSRGGRLSADIQAVVAADYIRNLREETRKGFYGRLKQGLYPLAAPVGYSDNGKGKPKTPHPVNAPLVRQAFELYASGRYALKQLRKEMYDRGLRNRSGGVFSVAGLAEMLRNPFYIGIIRLKRTDETFHGIHEPIISKTLFDRVQAVLDGKIARGSQRHEWLFRRLLRCGHCGASLVAERQKGNIYYRCHTSRCPTKTVREERIERALLELLSAFRLTPHQMSEVRAKVSTIITDRTGRDEEARLALVLGLNKINAREARLVDAYVDGVIDEAAYRKRNALLIEERVQLEKRINSLKADNPAVAKRVLKFLELAKSALQSYLRGGLHEKRDLIEILTSNRTATEKTVTFQPIPALDCLRRRDFASLVALVGTEFEPPGRTPLDVDGIGASEKRLAA